MLINSVYTLYILTSFLFYCEKKITFSQRKRAVVEQPRSNPTRKEAFAKAKAMVIMMSEPSKMKIGTVSLFPIFCMITGAIFLFFPEWVLDTLSTILGILIILYGAWNLLVAIRSDGFSRGGAVFSGLACILFGIYIIRHTEQVFSLLPLAAGIFFLFDGIDRLRSAYEMRKLEKRCQTASPNPQFHKRFQISCIIGAVTLLVAVFLLLYPFGAVKTTLRIIGFFVFANAISALWTYYARNSTIRIFNTWENAHPADGKINADFRDITNENEK